MAKGEVFVIAASYHRSDLARMLVLSRRVLFHKSQKEKEILYISIRADKRKRFAKST